MRKLATQIAVASSAMLTTTALATNGDNMMAVGPNARAMGGVGVAAPQDAISAVFANPAAMCFTPGCEYSEINFAGTLFMPHVKAQVDLQGMGNFEAKSKQNIYTIPAIGLSMPIDKDTRRWRFGLAAYGTTGLGVDYRQTQLDQQINTGFPPPNDKAPLIQGAFTSLMILKFAPSISYQISPNISVGAAVHVDYATLDLRNGSSPAYGFGGQLGAIYRPVEKLSLGITYITPQSTEFRNVIGTPAGSRDLELESPHQVAAGVSHTFFNDRLLVEVDGKYLNWAGAAGYKDFGWKDQWIAGVGGQFALLPKRLFVRAGYNYGNNPVEIHNGWGASPTSAHVVQGTSFPDYYYETFRTIGFPAIVEHHATFGIGYSFSDTFELNLGYTHAFENSITENGHMMGGPAAQIKSSLSEDSVEFGVTWRF